MLNPTAALRTATLALCALALGLPVAAQVEVSFLHSLSDFSGVIPYNDVRVHVDRRNDEVYVADGSVIRVFSASGMEIYQFGFSPEFGAVRDLAVDEGGDVLVLSYDFGAPAGQIPWSIVRCDFRGEPIQRIEPSGLPDEFASIGPNRLVYRDGQLLLVSQHQMLAVSLDLEGAFQQGWDLGRLAEVEAEKRAGVEIFGFSVAPSGDMLFTVPVLFKAFVVSPEGKVRSFGKAGSAPGKFGIVSGITVDDLGNYLVTDKLRCVLMMFDPEFRFLREFGYRGGAERNLIAPSSPAMGNNGRIYLTQLRNRGIAVFSVRSGGR